MKSHSELLNITTIKSFGRSVASKKIVRNNLDLMCCYT